MDDKLKSYEGGATFNPHCPKCGLYVTADEGIFVSEESGLKKGDNATCTRCGRVEMHFLGFI